MPRRIRAETHAFPLSHEGGTYPRAALLRDGALFATFDRAHAGRLELHAVRSVDGGRSWSGLGEVAWRPAADGRTLANAFPLQLRSGHILVAYRDHVRAGSDTVHRLPVSRGLPGGEAWRQIGVIETNRGPARGLWEPFLLRAPEGSIHAYYAREKPGGDQDIVLRRSADDGRTWDDETTVASQAGSRDGMPAAVVLPDGSLVVIFESFRAAGVPRFVLRSVQSTDGGRTWTKRRDVHVPEDASRNAGAPFLVRLADGRLLASFMTDDDVELPAWPHRANLAVLLTDGVATFASLRWEAEPTLVESAPVYWPALVVTGAGEVLALYDQGGPKAKRLLIER